MLISLTFWLNIFLYDLLDELSSVCDNLCLIRMLWLVKDFEIILLLLIVDIHCYCLISCILVSDCTVWFPCTNLIILYLRFVRYTTIFRYTTILAHFLNHQTISKIGLFCNSRMYLLSFRWVTYAMKEFVKLFLWNNAF